VRITLAKVYNGVIKNLLIYIWQS